MAHDLRQGLVTLPSRDAIVPSWRDARQWILAAAADRRVVGKLLGGPGVYAGGAAGLADLGDGTVMPALVALVADGAGELWAVDLPASVVRFDVTDAAAAEVWLEPRLIPSLAAPAALGGAGDWQVVARASGPAPASSLLLGTGSIAGSKLTSWTPASGPGAAAVTASPAAHAVSHASGGADAITPASIGAVATTDPRLSDARTALAHAASHAAGGSDVLTPAALGALPLAGGELTGILGLIAGGLRIPRWPHFGPPTAGSADLLGFDRSGALWLHDGAGWRQLTAGTPLAWSGGGADDVTAAANWADGILDGYRAYESAYGGEWQRHGGLGRWTGREQQLTLAAAFIPVSADGFVVHLPLNREYDMLVRRAGIIYIVGSGTVDGSNFWTLSIQTSGSIVLLSSVSPATGTQYVDQAVAEVLLATTTIVQANIRALRTGNPPNATVFGARINYREVRK